MNTVFKKYTYSLLVTCIIILLANIILILKTTALSGNDFKSGRIIDDIIFYNSSTMSPTQIQQFLGSKVPVCDTNGTQSYAGTTRAAYGTSRGYPPPYICLKEYTENVKAVINSGSDLCKGSITTGTKNAAQIIYDVAQACGINPQVLIVLLQKEQSLVADDWPWSIQYRSATGYGCPDTAPCESEYYGFFNQIYQAAKAFRRYESNPTLYNYRSGRNNFVYHHPSLGACGGSNVFIENQATANLYIYTPYQPNSAALNNLYGTGDSCSAYGNRNFWRLFNDWFGDPTGNTFIPLTSPPRFMQIKKDTYKKQVFTGEDVGILLEAGRQIKIVDKIYVNGSWYLRTEWNYNNGDSVYGILQSDLEEIPYVSIEPKWLTFKENGNRSVPSSRTSIWDSLVRGTSVKVVDQITIDGNIYYRTEFNQKNNQNFAIHTRFLTDFTPVDLDVPRNFCSNTQISKLNLQTGTNTETAEPGEYFINKKTLVNGTWFYQTQKDNSTMNYFNSNELRDFCFIPFVGPRNLRINQSIERFNPYTNETYGTLSKGMIINFSSKIFIFGGWYYRTTYNTINNTDAVVPAYATTEIEL